MPHRNHATSAPKQKNQVKELEKVSVIAIYGA